MLVSGDRDQYVRGAKDVLMRNLLQEPRLGVNKVEQHVVHDEVDVFDTEPWKDDVNRFDVHKEVANLTSAPLISIPGDCRANLSTGSLIMSGELAGPVRITRAAPVISLPKMDEDHDVLFVAMLFSRMLKC